MNKSRHVWMSHGTYIWVMSHMNESGRRYCELSLISPETKGGSEGLRDKVSERVGVSGWGRGETYIHIHTYTYIYIHTYIHTNMCVCIYVNIHIYIYIRLYIYVYTYLYIHIYIHTHIRTYTQKSHTHTTSCTPAHIRRYNRRELFGSVRRDRSYELCYGHAPPLVLATNSWLFEVPAFFVLLPPPPDSL